LSPDTVLTELLVPFCQQYQQIKETADAGKKTTQMLEKWEDYFNSWQKINVFLGRKNL